MNEFIIQKLTELYIKQYEEDKTMGKPTYIKKMQVYKDLIDLFKNHDFVTKKG